MSTSKFSLGDHVRKASGSQWKGIIVGTYSTALTPEGYAVESDTEKGSVQIYPAKALELYDQDTLVPSAMKTITKAMQDDPEYAWAWHCNIAMAFVDAGGDHYTGNQGAARFMKLLANVEPAHELPGSPQPKLKPQQEPEPELEPKLGMGISDNPYCNDSDCNEPNSRAMRWHNKLLAMDAAKAQPQQEPVAWANLNELSAHFQSVNCGTAYRYPEKGRQPLYTVPQDPQPQLEPLAWIVAGKVQDWSKDFSAYQTQLYVRPVYATPQPQQEPVAWRAWSDSDDRWLFTLWPEEEHPSFDWEPLYTSPPQRQPLTDEPIIWVLTSEYNAYNQEGEYFEAVFIGKPSSEQIQKYCGINEAGAAHILAGGGRKNYENSWYLLKKVKAAHGIGGEK